MSEQASSDAAPHRSLVVRAVLRTDVGLVRSENQDFGVCTTPSEERDAHAAGRLLVVADGMGGHRGGATASRIAGETVKAQFLGSETSDIATALRESLTRANARIYSEAHSNPDLRGMGTTTSALAVRGDHAWLAHVGDSRIYLVRDDTIRQLTEDHSLVATMVREGLLTPQEAEVHPRRNVLQRSMGVSDDVEIDIRGPFQLREGDTFILCSDGLHGLVKEQELKEIAQGTIEDAADEFLRRALERGAPDNVTVIVARVEQGDGLDVSSYDETLTDADTQKLIAVTDEELRETDKIRVVGAEESSSGSSVPRSSSGPSGNPRRGTSRNSEELRGTRWPWLILILVLGAAGAWYYLSQ
jgi:protein phosphatase